MRERLVDWLPFLALVAITAVLAPMVGIGFLNDDYAIIDFALHDGLSWPASLLSRAEVIEVYYRPLFDLTLGLNSVPGGPLFRLTNLLLHLANVVLLFKLADELGFDRHARLAAVLLFGLHPIHEMSLYWIAGRTDVLCTTFYLLALLYARRHLELRRTGDLAASLVSALLAMLSKEMAITLPLAVAVIAWWQRRDLTRSHVAQALASLRAAIPLAVVIAGVLLARLVLLDNNLFGAEGVHGSVPLAQIVRNVATYVGLLVIPAGHEAIEGALRARPMLFMGIAVAALAAGALALWRWRGSLSPMILCAALMLVTLVPVLRVMMRWYLYLPSVFFCLAVGWLVTRLRPIAWAPLVAIIAVGYAAIDRMAIDEWKSAGDLAATLGGDLASLIGREEGGTATGPDTLRFINIPGKLGAAPVFNLGFPATVRHHIGRSDVVVEIASKMVLPEYPASVAIEGDADGTMRIVVGRGGWFTLSTPRIVAQQSVPGVGDTIPTEAGDVSIVSATSANRATAIGYRPERRPGVRYIVFDGARFIPLDSAVMRPAPRN